MLLYVWALVREGPNQGRVPTLSACSQGHRLESFDVPIPRNKLSVQDIKLLFVVILGFGVGPFLAGWVAFLQTAGGLPGLEVDVVVVVSIAIFFEVGGVIFLSESSSSSWVILR